MPRTPRLQRKCLLALATLLMCLAGYRIASAQVVPKDGAAEGSEDSVLRQREEWFWKQRAYPFQSVPPGARWKALQHKSGIQNRLSRAPNAPPDPFASVVWTQIGPQPIQFSASAEPFSGRVTSIAISPVAPYNTVFLGTAGGGVWKTIDGGSNWVPLTDTQPSLAIGAVTVDPNNPNTIYAGTGEPNSSSDSYYGEGLLKSTDGGATWISVRAPFAVSGQGTTFSQIAVQPGNSSIVLAATGAGLFRSADAGITWVSVSPLLSTAVLFSAGSSSTAYAALGGDIYKSVDAGVTWAVAHGTGKNVLPPSISIFRVALAQDQTGANLYASLAKADFTAPGYLFKSTDGGTNWAQLLPNPNAAFQPPPCCDWYRNSIAVDPSNPNVIYLAGTNASFSLDGGKNWNSLDDSLVLTSQFSGLWPDKHAFAFAPDGSKMFLGSDGGIFSTTNPATASPAFADLNPTLATMTFYPGLSVPHGSAVVTLAGSQDHGLDRYTGQLAWNYADNDQWCGDGGATYVDSHGTAAYASCQGNANWISNPTGGKDPTRWQSAEVGINLNDRRAWVPPVTGDLQNDATVYTGTYRVYQSKDGAANWVAISPDVTAGSGTLNTIAVAPSNSDVVYSGSGDGVVSVTQNALSPAPSWTKLAGLPNRSISKIVVLPDSSADVFVVVGGFGTGHVFHSTDGGVTWADISANLPDSPANGLVVDPDIRNTYYLATDTGVYFTETAGASWMPLGSSLPNVVIQDLALIEPARTLRAITHGRSAWDVALPAALGLVPAPSSLTFAGQNFNTASTAQSITLTNSFTSKTIALTAISVTGSFSETNNCGASLAAGQSCTVNAIFDPQTAGSFSGSINITTDSTPVVIPLAGAGLSTFTLTPAIGSATVTEGQPATYTLTLASQGGPLSDDVHLSCSNLPADAVCTFSPASVAAGVTTQTIQLTISTALPRTSLLNAPSFHLQEAFLAVIGLCAGSIRFKRRRFLLFTVLTGLALVTLGCGGGGGSSHSSGVVPGTPAGNYNVSVIAQAQNYQTTQNVTLQVK